MLCMLCILSIKHSIWWCTLIFMHQNVIQHGSCICCLTPQLLSFICSEPCKVHHSSGSSHNHWKGTFYISILLRCPSCSILKYDAQSFSITFFFKLFILSCIITSYLLYLYLILGFQTFNHEHHFNLV